MVERRPTRPSVTLPKFVEFGEGRGGAGFALTGCFARGGWEGAKRTLTNLYNQRPTWLDLAHKKLNEAVFAAYGWPSNLSDEGQSQSQERYLNRMGMSTAVFGINSAQTYRSAI